MRGLACRQPQAGPNNITLGSPADYPRPDERRLNGTNAPFEAPPVNRAVGWKRDLPDLHGL
jgi:hypothetical protein